MTLDEFEGEQQTGIFVANGELGRVVAVEEKLTIAQFEGPSRLVKIPRGTDNGSDSSSGSGADEKDDANDDGGDGSDGAKSDTGCSFDLGYAVSCHKSQGSEWPVVIIALDDYPGARRVCSREWIYTGISRAKSVCLLVGKKSIADGMCLRRALHVRKTFLRERIQQEVTRINRERAVEPETIPPRCLWCDEIHEGGPENCRKSEPEPEWVAPGMESVTV